MTKFKDIFDNEIKIGTPVISRATDETFIFVSDYTEGMCIVRFPNRDSIPFQVTKESIVKFKAYVFLQWLELKASVFNKKLARYAKSH